MAWSLHILAAWMLQSTCLPAFGSTAPVPPEAASVHRFWSPAHGRHFYTLNEAEKDKLLTRAGNHDYFGSGAPWFFYFFDRPISQGWFALTCGNTRIIGLETSVPFSTGSPQHNWLLQEFASTAYHEATGM